MKSIGVVGLLSATGIPLSSCKSEEEMRTQFLWIKNSEFNGFYAADYLGYYEEEGIAHMTIVI